MKMKMGHDPRKKSAAPREVVKVQEVQKTEPPVLDMAKVQEATQKILENHKELFKRLAEEEAKEKQRPLATMKPECGCKPQLYPGPKRDSKARKHSILLREEFEADRKELDDMLTMHAQSTDQKMVKINQKLVELENKLENVIDLIPEENQVVREIVIEKPVTDKKVWMCIGLAILLNIAFILLK